MSGAPIPSWQAHERAVFERLRTHAMMCPRCEAPGIKLAGGEVRISSRCEDGILLLTEWFTAKMQAERQAFEDLTGDFFPEARA